MKPKTLFAVLCGSLFLAGSSLSAQPATNSAPAPVSASDLRPSAITSTERGSALAAAVAGKPDSVEPALTALSEREPTDVEACLQLARLRLQHGDPKSAVALLERATAAEPGRSDLQSELGFALSRRISQVTFMQQAMIAGKMRSAYEKSVALDPKNINGLIGLTQYFANAPAIAGGSMEKAATYAKEVEKLDPYQGALQLALLAEKQGNLDEMKRCIERAAAVDSSSPWPYVQCGYAYLGANRPDDAKVVFEVALKRRADCEPATSGLRKVAEMLSGAKH